MSNKSARRGVAGVQFARICLGLAVGAACWVGSGPDAFGGVEEGAKPKKWAANPAKHQVSIRRNATSDLEKKMIGAAESAYPPKADVVAAGKLQDAPADERLWSHKEVLGVKMPYALTGAAIDYYRKFVEDSGKKSFTRYLEPSSKFAYEATVTQQHNYPLDGKTLPRVFVVKMKASFDQSFVASGTEAVHFEKEREVVLDPGGKVLKITGDGDTEVPMLAI